MVSEASFLSSGFAVYTREILSRLYKTNKYDIAEFACYGLVNDPRDKNIPWKYYANAVREDDPRYSEYSSRSDNQFGRWRFEKVLLDFKPDIVIDIRDYWMNSYQALSPLRKFFHWILMPTVDSAPQQEDWIDTFLSADSVFTYSDWGAEVLKQQSSNKINYIATVSPGVDLSIFQNRSKQEKNQIRKILGLPEDAIIFGSVMRNQKRKLIPELFLSFRNALDKLSETDPDKASKLYLYLHTSYPDAGWDIPEILKDNRLCNRVFFTYLCRKCGAVLSKVFTGPAIACPSCMEKLMTFSSVTNGITSDQLAKVYSSFDAYIQYSICEGFGCPQTEAGASGLPIITVNYSAMCDIVKKLNAIPIQPAAFFKELETKAIRVYPDNKQLSSAIITVANMSEDERKVLGDETRKLTEKYYHWDDIANKWIKHLDHLAESCQPKWDAAPAFFEPLDQKLSNVSPNNHYSIINNIFAKRLGNKNLIGSMISLNLMQQADYGFSMHGMSVNKHSFGDAINFANMVINNNNQSEQARIQNIDFTDDFIQYASIKQNTINPLNI